MKDEEGVGSTSSSPIPISTGPGNHKYSLSSLPSLSLPLSPPGSSNTSAENVFILHDSMYSQTRKSFALSSFSLDKSNPAEHLSSGFKSCIIDLLEWFALRCCSCCTWNLNPPSKLHHE